MSAQEEDVVEGEALIEARIARRGHDGKGERRDGRVARALKARDALTAVFEAAGRKEARVRIRRGAR